MNTLYKALIWTFLSIAFLGLPLSFLAFGSDFQQQQNPLYPYQSTIFLQEDFVSGLTASGTIGHLGWILSNGTGVYQPAEPNRIGIFRRDTSAVINTTAALGMHNGSPAIDMTLNIAVTFAARLNTNDANTTIRWGMRDNYAGLLPTAGMYFEKLDADVNWFCVARQGGAETRVDSGVVINTNFNTFTISKNSSGITYIINGATVCGSPVTTNQPTGSNNYSFNITNSAAAAKTFDLDYAQIMITGISR